jgi:hypothetical protein
VPHEIGHRPADERLELGGAFGFEFSGGATRT